MAKAAVTDSAPPSCESVRPPTSPRQIARLLGADLLFCAGVALFLTVIFGVYKDGGADPKTWLIGFLLNMIISTSIGMSLSNLYRFAQPPILARFPGPLAYYLSHAVIVVAGVAIGVEVALRIIGAIGGPAPSLLRADVLRIGLAIAIVIVATTVAFDRLRARARATELVAEQAQKEALRAQLAALQARTNPHFLFNSLNTVAGLIEEDPQGAERVIEKLSGLFRYALDGSKTEWVRLEREIEAVNAYLEVEAIRLGDRLRSEISIEPGVEGLLVPPLLLQPLVENAVLHAVAPRRGGGRIAIRVDRNGSHLRLAVEDDGPGLGNSEHRGSGTSLDDLRQRLGMIYGERATLSAGPVAQRPGGDGDRSALLPGTAEENSREARGCRVVVRLPLEGEPARAAATTQEIA